MKKYGIKLLICALMSVGALYAQRDCYECVTESLECGSFDIQISGGFAPIYLKNRGGVYSSLRQEPTSQLHIQDAFEIPKAGCLFYMPGDVSGQVGYAYSEKLRFFIEGDMEKARQKNEVAIPLQSDVGAPAGTKILLTLQKPYRAWSFSGGVEYYSDRFWHYLSLFVGAKLGVIHHDSITVSLIETLPFGENVLVLNLIDASNPQDFLVRSSSVLGGLLCGLDICLKDNLSFVITAEALFDGGQHGNHNVPLNIAFSLVPNNFLVSGPQTEIHFPVTFGLRYSF